MSYGTKKLQYPTVMRSINNPLSTERLYFTTWFKMRLFRTLKVIPLQNTFTNPNRAEKIKLGKTASTQTIWFLFNVLVRQFRSSRP